MPMVLSRVASRPAVRHILEEKVEEVDDELDPVNMLADIMHTSAAVPKRGSTPAARLKTTWRFTQLFLKPVILN